MNFERATAGSLEDLIVRAADLKSELVAFAQSSRFERRLTARLMDAADDRGYLDEGLAIATIDHFALQYRLSDGRTVVERFVTQHRPPLPDGERDMVLGWRDVVQGCFEARSIEGDAVVLHNLIDDVVYRVYSNMGVAPFARLRKGMFVIGRIVPLRPDAWLVSGHLVFFPKTAARQAAQSALTTLTANPELLHRNQDLTRRAWEMQAEDRADFIELFGADLMVLPVDEVHDKLREHYRRRRDKALARLDKKSAERAIASGPDPDVLAGLPAGLQDAETVGVIYDEVEGLNFYRDFGRADALFADPVRVGDRTSVAVLRGYLRDDSVSTLPIRRLVERHREKADQVFRKVLGKPGFCWETDGEDLLRRRKKEFFDRTPTPSISVVGARLAELLRGGR
ncbi:hypothetical protein ACQP1O_17570 [Nocardia sp. CA-151230]|uniref:hypothetical protein n=1 Tax=Nocardia sp. CA-151230 TaxID=3239982 RepID=UPI003D9183C1